MEYPKDIEEYTKWLHKKHGYQITRETRTYYDSVTRKMREDLESSSVWKDLLVNLQEYNDEYLRDKGFHLLSGDQVTLHTKPWDSFFLKTYRKNILENAEWPSSPTEGWILPDNWFSKINDIVRTLITVKYLDGVEFLIQKLEPHFQCYGVDCSSSFEAKDEGYYAAHLVSNHSLEIPKVDWDTERISAALEIQVTTQLQEVIRRLLHTHYEQRRASRKTPANPTVTVL